VVGENSVPDLELRRERQRAWRRLGMRAQCLPRLSMSKYSGFMPSAPAAISVSFLESPPENRVQSVREFVTVVRREVGAVAIDADSINRLWRFIVDLPDPELDNKTKI